MAVSIRAWDSDAILALLLKESGKWEDCVGTLQAAEAGSVKILVSALAIAEVLMTRGHDKLPRERAQIVRAFFRRSWIVVRVVDRTIAEMAQELVWDEGIDPKDAIHVATALRNDASHLDTFDRDLMRHSGTLLGKALIVGRPDLPAQGTLNLDDD